MEHILITEAQKKTSPNPITLVCVERPDNSTNLTAVSWWTYLTNHPPMIGFSVSQKSYCAELIPSSKGIMLCIPSKNIINETFNCGCFSGRDVNKSEKFGIELIGADTKFPKHSKLAFKCKIEKSVEVGDHIFFVCKVDDILYNKDEIQIYSWDGYSHLDTL